MKTLYLAAEAAHLEALGHARRAIRAGDLAKAERWMRLSLLHWRNASYAGDAQADAAQRRARRRNRD